MSWMLEESGFDREHITTNGNKFMIGNGVLGYRGTHEEYTKEQLTATTLAGLYDKVGDNWREPINAPNALATRLYSGDQSLGLLAMEPISHTQSLNIRHAVHGRHTTFRNSLGTHIDVVSERFASMENLNMIAMKYQFCATEDCVMTLETGINADVWDINGPHLEQLHVWEQQGILGVSAITHELGAQVVVAEALQWEGEGSFTRNTDSSFRQIEVSCKAGEVQTLVKYAFVSFGQDVVNAQKMVLAAATAALAQSYDTHLAQHTAHWERKWEASDIAIEGDEEAQFALRYSLYQLHIIAPTESEKVSIPARGLSGQVYKGAVFWDTEMFMLPFFLYTQPEIARNLVMYRVHTLDGARRKAAEYGFRGAFYAWESQDTGDDACTLFNITDVFTNRPMRTYFRDKQVHISADVAIGLWKYYEFTGDESALLDGGAEVILECARFFYSYSYFKTEKNRYEILDVTGPDEYHERVNNNAFTNMLALQTIEIALKAIEVLAERHPAALDALLAKLEYQRELEQLKSMLAQMYVPAPNEQQLIEQFDGYFGLEDVDLATLKSRVIHPNEYLGGGSGLATTTQILKQADVVLMLHLFKGRYSQAVKKANWDYYEPRTEHGSSLSSCIYALVAADIGYADWAYDYFMRTATIDLTGKSKQYVGTLYIGGTHPAANGGAWMAAALGFAGVHYEADTIYVNPSLPTKWTSVQFKINLGGQQFTCKVTHDEVCIQADRNNREEQAISIHGEQFIAVPGAEIQVFMKQEGVQHA